MADYWLCRPPPPATPQLLTTWLSIFKVGSEEGACWLTALGRDWHICSVLLTTEGSLFGTQNVTRMNTSVLSSGDNLSIQSCVPRTPFWLMPRHCPKEVKQEGRGQGRTFKRMTRHRTWQRRIRTNWVQDAGRFCFQGTVSCIIHSLY